MTVSSRLLLVAMLAVFFSGTTAAQNLPADCSSAAAPKQPVEASILGIKEKTPTKEESYAVGTFQARIEK